MIVTGTMSTSTLRSSGSVEARKVKPSLKSRPRIAQKSSTSSTAVPTSVPQAMRVHAELAVRGATMKPMMTTFQSTLTTAGMVKRSNE